MRVKLSYWCSKDDVYTPTRERFYIEDELGNKLGFVGLCRKNRSPNGSYEIHRKSKGERIYNAFDEATLAPDLLEKIAEIAIKSRMAFLKTTERKGLTSSEELIMGLEHLLPKKSKSTVIDI
jgi:hypothetical protein